MKKYKNSFQKIPPIGF